MPATERRRRDLFGECNADGHPIEVFTRECCAGCFNPECTRSLKGKLKFDDRTQNWYENFFGDKNRMDQGDPRYPTIAAQQFKLIDPGLTGRAPEVGTSSWIDPRDIKEPSALVQAPHAPEVRQPIVMVPEPRQVAAQVAAPSAPAPVAFPVHKVPHQLLLANAPMQTGQMVTPPPSQVAAQPPKDPWTGPVPTPKSDVPVVSPGARVKLGGGGV